MIHVLRAGRLLGTLANRATQAKVIDQYPEYVQRHLGSTVTYAARQTQQLKFEAQQLAQILGPVGIKPVFLKGAAYALRNSTNNMGRTCSDIDVLIRKSELADAERAMHADGWRSEALSEYDDRYYREWAHEIPPVWHPTRGTVVDLHHNIVPPISGRAPRASILFEHVETLPSESCVLAPPAMVLHSLVHLLVNDDLGFAYRDLVDLWLLTEEYDNPEFWSSLESLAKQTGFERELWYGLTCIRAHFPTSNAGTGTLDRLAGRVGNWRSKFVVRRILVPAIKPRHPDVRTRGNSLAGFAAYARGHWLKMPLPILIKHLATKSWLAARDLVFGKYQFEKTDT